MVLFLIHIRCGVCDVRCLNHPRDFFECEQMFVVSGFPCMCVRLGSLVNISRQRRNGVFLSVVRDKVATVLQLCVVRK